MDGIKVTVQTQVTPSFDGEGNLRGIHLGLKGGYGDMEWEFHPVSTTLKEAMERIKEEESKEEKA